MFYDTDKYKCIPGQLRFENWIKTVLYLYLSLIISSSAYAATVSLSWDPNSDASYYVVYWGETSKTYTFQSPAVPSPSTTFSTTVADGKTYYFAVRAFNDCGNSSVYSAEVVYTGEPVLNINLPPIADAGPDQTATSRGSVSLNGSKSSDSDGSIASYSWLQTGGTNVTLSGAGTATATFTAPDVSSQGTVLTFQLTVTDSGGLSATDTCAVTLYPSGTTTTVTLSWDPNSEASYYVVYRGESPGNYTFQSEAIPSPATSYTATVNDGTTSYFAVKAFNDCGNSSSFSTEVVYTGAPGQTTHLPPIADAGSNQIVSEGTSVSLDGSKSSSTYGSIASYTWAQTAGPAVSLTGAGTSKPTFTAPDVGTQGTSLTFRLTVTDSGGLSSTDTCTVDVTHVNAAPMADAGPDQSVKEGTTVTLNGANSTDPDDGITSYQWAQISGTSVSLSNTSSASPTFLPPDVVLQGASLTFQLTVTDYGGLSATDTCIVNVSYVNEPPTADAGPDQTVSETVSVTLNGQNSSDRDDGIISYLWAQTSGPLVNLSSPSAASPTFTPPDVGVNGSALTFQLTVIDIGGLSASDTCIVNVTFVNVPPKADAGPDQSVSEGTSVTLNGVNSTDVDDGIKSFIWTQTGGLAVKLSNAADASPSFTSPDVGVSGSALTFQLTVTDFGGLSATDSSIVNVSYINTPPTADAGPDQTVSEGDFVTLNGANSSDTDDGITSFLWTQTGGTSVTLSDVTTASPTFTPPDVGVEGACLTFQLTVTDSGGLSTADSCIVNISFINEPPTADAGPDQTLPEATTVTLTGVNSADTDDGIASYLWTQTGGTSVNLSDPASHSPTFTSPDVGVDGVTLTFQLTVTDLSGLSGTDTCIVNVSNVNEAPVADAGPDQMIIEGFPVILNGGNSTDSDDGIKSYLWTQIAGPSVTFSDAAVVSPLFASPDVGIDGASLTFQLTVTDYGGLSATDTCIVNITYANVPPVADAGPGQTVLEGTTVILSGERSTDSDDGIASYLWTQTGGPSVTLSSTSASSPTFTSPDVGVETIVLTFQLTVTDTGGLSSSDSCIVNVTYANEPPTADAGADQTVAEGTTVTLDASGSTDPDDGIAHYTWVQTGGITVTLSSTTDISPTFTAPDVSTAGADLSFRLVVEDVQGVLASDTCTVRVNDSAIVVTPTEPVTPSNLIGTTADYPSVEVLDENFQHKYWLNIGWKDYNVQNGEARVATGDIDGDGNSEIIIGLAAVPDNPSIPGGFFQILDHNFTHLAWGYVNWPEYNALNGETWPACGDLDGDGKDEIVIGLGKGGEGVLEVFEYDQGGIYHREWIKGSWDEYNAASGESRPALGDINQDGTDEIIVGLGPSDSTPGLPAGFFDLIDSTFAHMAWGKIAWPDYNSANGETWPAAGDIFGTGKDHLIMGLGTGGNGQVQVIEFNSQSSNNLNWMGIDWPEYNDLSGETRPSAADIDNDGRDEILTGLAPVARNRSIPNGMFQANDHDLNMLTWGQVNWSDYNVKNGETRIAKGVIQGKTYLFISLGTKPVKTTGSNKPHGNTQ